ncbi:MAG: PilZ domain-containing protein [Elusimicrobiota bacterium]
MSPKHNDPRRRHSRFLTDLRVTIWDSAQKLLDDRAVAHDVTRSGFGFETKVDIRHISRIFFELELSDRNTVTGAAQLVWTRRMDWGSWAGAQITELERGGARRIHRVIHGPGYDWKGLADRALISATIVICVMVVDDLFRRHPSPWDTVFQLWPLAMILCGIGLVGMYFAHRN